MKILVTGAAGFIGFHLTKALVDRGDVVVGVDNMNDYYDPILKAARLKEMGIETSEFIDAQNYQSANHSNYSFTKIELSRQEEVSALFVKEGFDKVMHLAAQAGVRYSLENPQAYVNSNIVAFTNILEACRHNKVKHLVYASSSSVYGLNEKMPLSEDDNVDHPVSLYAASKKCNELMAHTYSHLFNLPTTGLRFFTVYGPWGRPDMALFLFADAILKGETINVFNHGNMVRDFTYVGDIVEGVVRAIDQTAQPNEDWNGSTPIPSSSKAPYKIYNIGNNNPVKLTEFIEAIENELGKKATKKMMDLQPGDVPRTYADVSKISSDLNYKPETKISYGIREFINWYKAYYKQE